MTLLNRWLSGTATYENYQAFVRGIVEPLYIKLGVEVVANDTKLDRYGRAIAINLACQAGLETCLNATASKLYQMIYQNEKVHPDLQSAIYCNGLRQANSTVFLQVQNKLLQSQDQAERTLIIGALGCTQNEALLSQFLNLAVIPGEALRLQEKFRVLAAPVNNGELGLRVMMEFIRYNFHAIISVSSTQVNTMLNNIASRVASKEIFDEFKSLLTLLEQFKGIAKANADNYQAIAQANLDWQEKNLEQIDDWLSGAGSVMISTIVLTVCAFLKFML